MKTPMKINIAKTAGRALTLCLGAALAVATGCTKDEFTSRGDLFQPHFAADPVVTNNNDVNIVWYKVNDAVDYTVQLYEDVYYQNLFMEFNTTESLVKIEDIPYASRFYVRVRSNAVNEINNSQWATTDFTTDPRPAYAQLLYGVSRSEIEDNGAYIHWNVDAANPVDSISIVPTMNPSLPTIGGYLTAEEIQNGEYNAKGLTPSTLYTVNIYDTSKPRKYDKPYNTVTFRTTGPDPETIEIDLLDDLSTILAENNEDPEIPEGTVYLIPEGATYTISTFSIRKGFVIRGPEDATTKPVIIMNGTWSAYTDAYISTFGWENVEVRNYADNQYFFNSGNPFTMESVNFFNVDFRHVQRGFWRHQNSNNKHIIEMTIDGCWFDQCGWQGSTYGTFAFGSAGKGLVGTYDQIDAVTIRNTTFSRGGYMQDSSWGWANLMDNSTTACPIVLTIENMTMYDFCVNATLVSLTNTENSSVTIRNCVMASNSGAFLVQGSGTSTVYSNNYYTTDYKLDGAVFGGTAVNKAAADIFADPANGDFTVTDKSSLIYMTGAGDPRWLK